VTAGRPPDQIGPLSREEARLARARQELRGLAWLLDSTFRIPGTRFRFGLDPIIGLVPGAGDIASGAISVYLLLRALQFRLPLIVIARMLVNTLLDLTLGAIPVIGDVFDFAYRSNARNIQLLEAYAGDRALSTRGEWLFFAVIAAFVVGIAVIGWLAIAWLVAELTKLP
jgi:hypothetical protein